MVIEQDFFLTGQQAYDHIAGIFATDCRAIVDDAGERQSDQEIDITVRRQEPRQDEEVKTYRVAKLPSGRIIDRLIR